MLLARTASVKLLIELEFNQDFSSLTDSTSQNSVLHIAGR